MKRDEKPNEKRETTNTSAEALIGNENMAKKVRLKK